MVRLPRRVLERYPRVSLFDSPYPAHDAGCAVDLYPHAGRGIDAPAPSPVVGVVVGTHTVRAPPKPYAAARDHLIVVDVDPACVGGRDVVARVLHVDPAVAAGERVAVGDDLGRLVRSGFFAPWVANHLHLGFRPPDADPVRARGSLRLELGCPVEPVAWDGRGTVVERGETYAVLNAPTHPAPEERFAGLGADGGGALDGGLPHYERGGRFGGGADGPVSLLGTRVGTASGRNVAFDPVTVRANGSPVCGLSLFLGHEEARTRVVCPDADALPVGTDVRVTIAAETKS